MQRKKLLWQIYPSYLLVILISLLVVAWYAFRSVENLYLDYIRNDLWKNAKLAAGELLEEPEPMTTETARKVCRDLGRLDGIRFTVALPSGRVIGDSDDPEATIRDIGAGLEIIKALEGLASADIRRDSRSGDEIMYLGYPIEHEGVVVGAVRVSLSLAPVNEAIGAAYRRIGFAAVFVILLAAAVVLAVSHRITRPLGRITEGAERFASGDLDVRLDVPSCEEMARLATAMNNMGKSLDEMIRTERQQRKQQAAVLSSMQEGVIAIDENELILHTNAAAARLLGLEQCSAQGRSLQEVARIPKLQDFARKALSSNEPVESEISFEDEGEGGKIIQAHGTVMVEPDGMRIGALMVLNDVSQLKRLERLRHDFVANVSHELKTPITTIKGFVETIIENPETNQEKQKHFLGIIEKQANRLDLLIKDILSLSRIEHEKNEALVELRRQRLAGVVREAIEICSEKAAAKKAVVTLDCDKDIEALINPALLEQALVNLIDNAVKYGDEGVHVMVRLSKKEVETLISVADTGPGIEKRHLDRLFERFYRIDKGRSRQMGGTGLGLSIVKHIATAHNGRVEVVSRPGQGTTFTMYLNA